MKSPKKGQADYFDAGYPALALRVTARGVRSWVYFGRVHGKIKRATLGRYPDLGLMQARRKAGETADAMRQGVDPAAAKRAARNEARDSFAHMADEWLKRDQSKNRSHAEVKRVIDRDVKPVWGGMLIAGITRRDVIDLIDASPTVERSFMRAAFMLTCIACFAGASAVVCSKSIRWPISRSPGPPLSATVY